MHRRNRREKIGTLDRRITLQIYTETQNGFGEQTVTFEDLKTVWASITYENRELTEAEASQRPTATTVVVFVIRYRADFLNKKNRIRYQEQDYDIEAIQEDGRRNFLKIYAQLRE